MPAQCWGESLTKKVSWLTKPAGYGPPWRPLSYCVAPPASVQSAGCSLRLVLLSECFVCFVLPEKETIIELRADHFHESPFSPREKSNYCTAGYLKIRFPVFCRSTGNHCKAPRILASQIKATYLLVTGSKHSTERRKEEPS